MKYRKKPVVIDAIKWDGINLEEIKSFVGEKLEYSIKNTEWQAGKGKPYATLNILTLEGKMRISEGDYVIKGVQGEFYPCNPDIFEQTYEVVD